jgi:uncharacterized protein YutE (UPF0331/DUF86 family)
MEVSTHLWYVWTEVAIEHEWLAVQAREAYHLKQDEVGHIEQEMKASLVAISATTHALDALQNEVLARGAVSSETLEHWRKKRPKAYKAVFQTLKETFESPELTPELLEELRQLYKLRNEVVHQRPTMGPFVVHPALARRTTPAAARYTVEAAVRAIDLLFVVLWAVTTEKDSKPVAMAWARTWRRGVSELSIRRNTRPTWISGTATP